MEKFKKIFEDYKTLNKRIEIEYETRVKKGRLEHDVLKAWELEGVGYNPEKSGDLKISSLLLALLRHPIKSPLCMIGYYLERKEKDRIY